MNCDHHFVDTGENVVDPDYVPHDYKYIPPYPKPEDKVENPNKWPIKRKYLCINCGEVLLKDV